MIPGKRINLWTIEKGDLLQNYLWANDPELVKLVGLPPMPKSAWEVEKWYETMLVNPNARTFAIKMNDGTYIGNAEIFRIDWTARSGELGIMIGDRKSRRQGYGREAAEMALRFAFEELGLHRICAGVLSFNEDSIKFFESLGFVREGLEREAFFTWGRFWDIVTFSMLAKEFFEKFVDENQEKGDKEKL